MVRGDKGVKRKTIVAPARFRDGTNFQNKSNQDLRRQRSGHWKYGRRIKFVFNYSIPTINWIKALESIKHCGARSGPRILIFCLFVAFGVSVSSHFYNVPVVGFDGKHPRHHKFNGLIFSHIGRDGNGQNVTLATAFVNVKNRDNRSWVFIYFIKDKTNF